MRIEQSVTESLGGREKMKMTRKRNHNKDMRIEQSVTESLGGRAGKFENDVFFESLYQQRVLSQAKGFGGKG